MPRKAETYRGARRNAARRNRYIKLKAERLEISWMTRGLQDELRRVGAYAAVLSDFRKVVA